jgi:hypothetical protein
MRAILDPMVKRLFSLVIALVIGSAPVMLDVCQIACGSKVAHSARTHDAHGDSPHHVPPTHGSRHEPTAALRLSETHPCDHDRAVAEPGIAAGRDSDSVPMPVAVRVPGTDDIALARPTTLGRAARVVLPDRPEVRSSRPLRI